MRKRNLLVILCLMILGVTGCGTEKEEEYNLDNFKLTDTCWGNDDEKMYCFSEENVYIVSKINGKYRVTDFDGDKAVLSKDSETEGSYSYITMDLLVGFLVQVKDNKPILWTTFYDTTEEKSINSEYDLQETKLSDLTFTNEKLEFAILGNNLSIELTNTFLAINMELPFYATVRSFKDEIKDKNGNLTGKQGYDFLYSGTNGKLYYIKTKDYYDLMSMGLSNLIEENKLCYKIGDGEVNSNFNGITKEVLNGNKDNITIHYCSTY